VEQNEFYFDSWVAAANTDPKARALLDRYSYHPPEELYDLNTDRDEFNNLADTQAYYKKAVELKQLLDKELNRQGETDEMIMKGPLPEFFDQSYAIRQNGSASSLSFNRRLWDPHVLIITTYLDEINNGGIVCDYFNNFRLYAYHNKIGLVLSDGSQIESDPIPGAQGELLLRLSEKGELEVRFRQQTVLSKELRGDLTKIKDGYVTCGKIQGEELEGKLQTYNGKITDLRFTMNELSREP
jgi:hypothetical protein